jgi:hypothetical protein
MMQQTFFALLLVLATVSKIRAVTLFSFQFRENAEGFVYQDNAFRNTTQGLYASGKYNKIDNGYLDVTLGGIDSKTIHGISGGWIREFTLPSAADVVIKINFDLYMKLTYERDEFAQALCSVDGVLVGHTSNSDNIGHVIGRQTGISPIWVTVRPGILKAGQHRLAIGAYNNKKTESTEVTVARFGYIILEYTPVSTKLPTRSPVKPPTKVPTKSPMKPPTKLPTKSPVKPPTKAPTRAPVKPQTKAPTKSPVKPPTKAPTRAPVKPQTKAPTKSPVKPPTKAPTRAPVKPITISPTKAPTNVPVKPLTRSPTKAPTKVPVKPLTRPPTIAPTKAPVKPITKSPTNAPTQAPTKSPSRAPSQAPTNIKDVIPPTSAPTKSPTKAPFTPTASDLHVTRINVGSPDEFIDPNGELWEADKYFDGKGSMYSQCPMEIAGTEADALYCKERYYNIWATPQPYRYIVPVPQQGAYTVKLHFAEIYYTKKGERVFDVVVNGKVVAAKLDIVDRVGPNTALIVPFTTKISGTSVTIELVPIRENPKICAIEVLEVADYVEPPTSAPVAQAFSLLINCGGNNFVEAVGGRTWTADQYFIGGNPYTDGTNTIANTLDNNLYQTERYGEFRYEIPVPANGSYEVTLHFAELYWQGIGERLFNVDIESTAEFKNVDIVALGEGKRLQAVTLGSIITVNDGFISIELSNSVPRVDNPKLSGIEIVARP